ncbi:hypothetical protein [Desulfocucumis palustris]|uniref:hypothetical protein n=1 Tax=Desulfocucumis palustris TaxID=1898651 RepID=UPI000FFEAAFA|nr:hypothetical protein [Desulfocucumis palustris]
MSHPRARPNHYTGDPSGRFLLTILTGVAELERETGFDLALTGQHGTGKWLGGIVPYEYIVNTEGYHETNENPLPSVNMTEDDVVRLIHRLVAEEK